LLYHRPTSIADILLGALQGYYPSVLVAILGLLFGTVFCAVGYIMNRSRGKTGTSAVPMWDYYAKRWRNAPLFEPIFAVAASTQTPPPRQAPRTPR